MSQWESVLTPVQHQQLEIGIHQIFLKWTAIQLAVDHSMLGSREETEEAFSELEKNICKWVAAYGDDLLQTEIADYIGDVLDEDLGLMVQDGSIPEISQLCINMFHACKRNDFSLIEQNVATTEALSAVANQTLPDKMEIEEEVDEDGFSVYRGKSRRGRRH